MSSDWEWCRQFIEHNCVYRSPPGEYLLLAPEGGLNVWQYYLPIAVLDQEFAERIERLFEVAIYGDVPEKFQLCGCESGGSLLVSVLQHYGSYPGFMVKKAAKSYGLQNWLEGPVDPELPVLLVDDIVGTGKTLHAKWEQLQGFGLNLVGCFAITTGDKRPILGEKHNLRTVYKRSDFALLHGEYTRKYGKEPQFLGTVT
jgi:orotate phosphoribosyltransferase